MSDLSLEAAREMARLNLPLPEQFYIDAHGDVQVKYLIGSPWCGCRRDGARCLRHQGWKIADE